jgi:hypothetical protein
MNRYIKITIFTLVCFCFNINNMFYACDQIPIPVISFDPNVFYVVSGQTPIALSSNSYDPDDGSPYGNDNGTAE